MTDSLCSLRTVEQRIADGLLRHYRDARLLRFHRADLDAYLRAHVVKPRVVLSDSTK